MSSSVLQLIDEDKQFNPKVNEFFKNQHVIDAGLQYHLVAVFGSQSTGKSTLLNALFSTEFGTMDQMSRQQTTKGIWMGVDKSESPLLVLDVEGTDGRERGEDQDFERKSALFALASSEVLIVNMWEHQVGLYQGANMGLLKTVFEVNLGLFQSSGQCPRSRILFVIRDHVGTPLENLSNTLKQDLNKHWDSIAKPEHLKDSQLTDYFDLDFIALPHKVLQPDLFVEKVKELRKNFPKFFLKEYHRDIPLDGWPHYAEQIWQQIELNKDLDLPTQQILVARFRCQEIADSAWGSFISAVTSSNEKFGGNLVVENFGAILGPLRQAALESFDTQASKYNSQVYKTERQELQTRLDTLLMAHYKAQLEAAAQQAVTQFKLELQSTSSKGGSFAEAAVKARELARKQYIEVAKSSALDAETYLYEDDLKLFDDLLDNETSKQRATEQQKINNKATKKIGIELADEIPAFFHPPTTESWQKALDALSTAVANALKPYKNGEDFGLGGTPQENKKAADAIQYAAWKQFDVQIQELTRPDTLVQRLRDVFDDKFQYDENGTPILWKQGDDIEGAYKRARAEALDLLPLFTSAKLDGEFIEPPQYLASFYRQEDYEHPNYHKLVSESRQEQVRSRFLKDANTAFLNAKRSVSHTNMHVPVWIWGVLVVLGWNEFMMILRNPLLIMLLILLGAGAFALHSLGMTQHALSVAQATLKQVNHVAKERLREYVHEPGHEKQKVAPIPSSAGGSVSSSSEKSNVEEFELEDL